jgi:hypothetical protein
MRRDTIRRWGGPKAVGGAVMVSGEEDERAEGDGCLLGRSVRLTVTLRRVE